MSEARHESLYRLIDAYKIPIDYNRFLKMSMYVFTDVFQIFRKLIINLNMVLIDASRMPIDSYRFSNISIGFCKPLLHFCRVRNQYLYGPYRCL